MSFTLALLFDEGQHFFLHELGVQARHGVVLQAALAALCVAAAVADGDGNHHGYTVLGDEIVQRREQGAVRSVGPDDERGNGAGNVLLGDVDRHTASVRCRVAGGDYKFGGVVRVCCAERALFACDARIDLAVGRFHGEVEDLALRDAFLYGHLRRGIVGGAEDEVSVGLYRRDGAVGQVLSLDVARRIGVAGRRRRAGRTRARRRYLGGGRRRGYNLGDCRIQAGDHSDAECEV